MPWRFIINCLFTLYTTSLILFSTRLYTTFYMHIQSINPLSCSPLQYNGSTCLLELQEWQSCLPERQNDSDVLISSDVEQDVQEEKLQMLLAGLQSLYPSEGCMTAFRSFWCLVLFGLCDGSGQRQLPSYEECITLQAKSCAVEKLIASGIPELAPLFQECAIFRLNTPVCSML